LDPGGFGSFLQETNLVRHSDTARVTKVLQHVPAQVITYRIGVPAVEVQQPLHAIGSQVAGLLGQRPGVFLLGTREQPQQLHPGPSPRVGLRETTSDQRGHVIEPGLPPGQAIILYSL
jgi:hypothetical protein